MRRLNWRPIFADFIRGIAGAGTVACLGLAFYLPPDHAAVAARLFALSIGIPPAAIFVARFIERNEP